MRDQGRSFFGLPSAVAVHCKQVAAVTREAFAVVKALGQGPETNGS